MEFHANFPFGDSINYSGTLKCTEDAITFESSAIGIAFSLPLESVFGVRLLPATSELAPLVKKTAGLLGSIRSLASSKSNYKSAQTSQEHIQQDEEANRSLPSTIPTVLAKFNANGINGTQISQNGLIHISEYLTSSSPTLTKSDTLAIFTLHIPKRPVTSPPKIRIYTITSTTSEFDSTNPSSDFCKLQTLALANTPKRVLSLVNPWGGTKQARKVVAQNLTPMAHISGIKLTILETERPLHAFEIGQTFKHEDYDAVVTVSGDGLFHEFVNGIMKRGDWYEVIKKPLGIVPGGSGNALAKSIDTIVPLVACLNLIRCNVRPFDMFAFRHVGSDLVKYGFVEVMWAFIADVDIESDKFRWAGGLRFILMAIVRLISFRKYTAKLHYLESSEEKGQVDFGQDQGGPKFEHLGKKDIGDVVQKNWKSLESKFAYFMAMNTPWCAHDTLPAPKCKISDGSLNLIWMEDVSIGQMLTFLLDTESGKYIREDYVQKKYVKAFVLEPERFSQEFEGILDVDGEVIKYDKLMVECLPSIATLIVPKSHNEDIWFSN